MDNFYSIEKEIKSFLLKFDELKEFIFIVLDKISKLSSDSTGNEEMINSIENIINQACGEIEINIQAIITSQDSQTEAISENSIVLNTIKEDAVKILEKIPENLSTSITQVYDSLVSLETKLVNIEAQGTLEDRLQSKLDSILQDVQTKLQENLAKIVSKELSPEETTSLEDRITQLINAVLSYCLELDQKLGSIDTVITEINNVKTLIGELQTKMSEFESNLDTALQYIIDNGDYMEEEPPFNPKPDKVYVTQAKLKSYRGFIDNGNELNFFKEYFIINNNAPAMLKVNYDIEIKEDIPDLIVEVYINDENKFQKTLSLTAGVHSLEHILLFQLQRTNGNVYLRFYSNQNHYKKVYNITYDIVGDNIVFLRDEADIYYQVFSCNREYYISRKLNNTIYYKRMTVDNMDFSQNFVQLTPVTNEYTFWPIFLSTETSKGENSIFGGITYAQLNYATNKVEIMDKETYTVKHTLDNMLDSQPAQFQKGGYFCYGRNAASVYQMNVDNSKGRSSELYANLNNVSYSSIVNFRKRYVNVSYVNNTKTLNSDIDKNLSMLFQDEWGEWYFSSKNTIASKEPYCIGFGTRVNLSHISPLHGYPILNATYYRIFMYVYDHWVVKYLQTTPSGKYTMLKAKVIDGDYDQIVAGTSNEYFTIKDGLFTKNIDNEFQPIEYYLK